MSHEFESGVFYGEAAWHGLGTTLDADDHRRRSVEGTIAAAGLDWSVTKYPTMIANSPDVPDEIKGAGIMDRYAVVRTSDWAILGNVGERYEPIQNRQMFDWFQPFLDSGECEFETAGSLKGGAIVWVLAKLQRDDMEIGQGDTIRKYLLLSSSHDGSMATKVGFAPIRVVCWNTLSAPLADSRSRLLSVRHTSGQSQSLEAIRDCCNTIDSQFEATAQQYRKLLNCKISPSELRRYVKLVLSAPEDDGAMSKRMSKQVDRIVNLASSGAGNEGKTAWDAYQGVTHWLTHERQKDASSRLNSLWFAESAKTNQRAFDLALQLAS